MSTITYGLPGIYRDEYGLYVWQPRAGVMGAFDIVRVTVCTGTVPERPSFDDEASDPPGVRFGPLGAQTKAIYPDGSDGEDVIKFDPDNPTTVHYEGRTVSSLSRSSDIIRRMRDTRNRPKQINAEQLVPEHVRTYYSAFWAGEQNALEINEAARLAKEERFRRMWWWRRLWEVMWVKQ